MLDAVDGSTSAPSGRRGSRINVLAAIRLAGAAFALFVVVAPAAAQQARPRSPQPRVSARTEPMPPPEFLERWVGYGPVTFGFHLRTLVGRLQRNNVQPRWQPTSQGWILRFDIYDELTQKSHAVAMQFDQQAKPPPEQAPEGLTAPGEQVSVNRCLIDDNEISGSNMTQCTNMLMPLLNADIPGALKQ